MHGEPSAISASATARVSGLGVCDALRVELEHVQLPWLVDVLEDLRGPLEEQARRARADQVRCDDTDSERVLADAEYRLRLLALMRRGATAQAADERPVLVGPAGMVGEAVKAALHAVTTALNELTSMPAPLEPRPCEQLAATATAAAAWAYTAIACRAVTAYTFDDDADPARAW